MMVRVMNEDTVEEVMAMMEKRNELTEQERRQRDSGALIDWG